MILVAGASGMLGGELLAIYNGTTRGVCRKEMEITSFASVQKVLLTLKPAVVINAMAFTDVDG